MAQGVCSAHVVSLCHLTFSFLMFRPSLLVLFLDGHFETFPDLDDLTDVSVHAILPNFPDFKAQVKRTPHEDEGFGYLAISTLSTRVKLSKFIGFQIFFRSTVCIARNLMVQAFPGVFSRFRGVCVTLLRVVAVLSDSTCFLCNRSKVVFFR